MTLHQSKCILLPSQRTLRDYTHHIKATNGFSSEVDVQLCQAANLKSCKLIDQYVVLLLDEMYIKEGLVYDKYTGELIGFTDLGDINSHLLSLEQSLVDSKLQPLATTIMTFMVSFFLICSSLMHIFLAIKSLVTFCMILSGKLCIVLRGVDLGYAAS